MMMTQKKKVFLVVNIPTHVRILMGAAELLQASGEYEPHMVYFPAAVFDHNQEKCAEATFPSLLWRGNGFVAGVRRVVAAQADASSIPDQAIPQASPLIRLMPQWLYKILKPSLGPVVRLVYPWWHKFIYSSLLHLRQRIAPVVGLLWGLGREYGTPGAGRGRRQPNALLLSAFAKVWGIPTDRGAHEGRLAYIWRRVGEEGMFPGVGAQKRFHAGLKTLFDNEGPALVVLPEDNLFYLNHLWIHVAHGKGVPVAIIPFTIANSLEWGEAFYGLRAFQVATLGNRLVAKAFPRWTLEHRGHRLILPRTLVVGSEFLGVAPDQPWVINSGKADVLCCESRLMAEYYSRAGISPQRIAMTGALSDDKLYAILRDRAGRRKALSQRIGETVDGMVVLIGLPPNQFTGEMRAGCEFATYEALIRFMIDQSLQALGQGGRLLINLHPRILPEEVAFLKDMDGVFIVQDPIEELVPLADLYVAVASATIRLAISCGVPVINFDAFQYHYDDYTGLKGVAEIRSKEQFGLTLHKHLQIPEFHASARVAQEQTAQELCGIDGRSGERLLATLKALAAPVVTPVI